jgi:hypothetical protein
LDEAAEAKNCSRRNYGRLIYSHARGANIY